MRILVDADACPVKELIIRAASKRKIPVVMVMDTSHPWQYEGVTVVTVDKARDGVDLALINMAEKDDVVVTQDYGVAALALGKGMKALNQNGLVFSSSNMDKLLFERHLGQKVRRAGGKTRNSRKRTNEDDEHFERALEHILDDALQDRLQRRREE